MAVLRLIVTTGGEGLVNRWAACGGNCTNTAWVSACALGWPSVLPLLRFKGRSQPMVDVGSDPDLQSLPPGSFPLHCVGQKLGVPLPFHVLSAEDLPWEVPSPAGHRDRHFIPSCYSWPHPTFFRKDAASTFLDSSPGSRNNIIKYLECSLKNLLLQKPYLQIVEN